VYGHVKGDAVARVTLSPGPVIGDAADVLAVVITGAPTPRSVARVQVVFSRVSGNFL
jgi:hypothetical protein